MMFEKYKREILLVVIGIIVVGAIGILESRKVDVGGGAGNQDIVIMDESERVKAKEGQYERAKEISTPDAFVNVDNISISELVGKQVILVDFWTYSCINCQRTLPYLNAWHEKYADDGLTIVGVHTPEFEFEKDFENVKRAVEKYGVEYPVVLDNDYSTWRSYQNRYWPRKYLIDIDGFIVYDHIGEGGYEETEDKIVELLNERSQVLGVQAVVRDESDIEGIDEVDFVRVGSPEMYFGGARVEYLANVPAQICLMSSCTYSASADSISLNEFALSGRWRVDEERATLESEEGSVFLRFSASKVNVVAGAVGGARAEIYLDGVLVGKGQAGSDVADGAVIFGAEDLYNLVDLRGSYGEHVLEMRFLEDGVSAFAFTFG